MSDPRKLLHVVEPARVERPTRHLGALKRETYDDASWQGKMPKHGPNMKLAMLAWIAKRHGNEAPAGGTPTGYAAPSSPLPVGAIALVVVLLTLAVLIVVTMVRDTTPTPPPPATQYRK